ncbi:hypothetical protein FACS1894137_11100 [Spirochaetia bacterium]|nr:hypothetical protein FACS1894137_11100 [Spirochaetia bacterium]
MDAQYEEIKKDEEVLAIIVRANFSADGYNFFTADTNSQQLAYIHHPKGKVILSHVHNRIKREVFYSKETIFIKRGNLRTDFYTKDQEYVCSRILTTGDVVLLSSGGHGFEVLEEVEMLVVKQGPYVGEHDKTRFERIEHKL